MRSSVARQFVRFGVVGALGFVVDSVGVLLLTGSGIAGPLGARIASFVAAASVTWKLNRAFTFGTGTGCPSLSMPTKVK